ncbi:MAG TPA: hypothetical protein VIH76_09470 [Candidatus Acidoferrales bacterium]
MTDQAHILDRVIRHLQPVFVFKVAAGTSRPGDHLIQQRDIFWMDSGTDQLKRYGHIPVKLKNAMEFL